MSGERQISRICAGLFRVGDFETADGFVVAGRHVHLPVGDGERVGFMVGGNHVLENFLRVDVVLGEHVVAGHEEPGGRVGIAVAETKPSRVLEHVVHALERTLLVHHKQGVVAVRTVRRRGLGENGTVGTVHHLGWLPLLPIQQRSTFLKRIPSMIPA